MDNVTNFITIDIFTLEATRFIQSFFDDFKLTTENIKLRLIKFDCEMPQVEDFNNYVETNNMYMCFICMAISRKTLSLSRRFINSIERVREDNFARPMDLKDSLVYSLIYKICFKMDKFEPTTNHNIISLKFSTDSDVFTIKKNNDLLSNFIQTTQFMVLNNQIRFSRR